jgi:RNA polymerase sigma-70 factor, ECF subfamily
MPFPFRRRSSAISSRAAFSQIYETNRRPVFRYLYGLTGGPPILVEDLLAETFLRAWKARRRFEGEAEAATGWLIRIARRLVFDDYRREQVRAAHSEQPDEPCADSLPEANALATEQRRILTDLLDGLPQEPREIVTLR